MDELDALSFKRCKFILCGFKIREEVQVIYKSVLAGCKVVLADRISYSFLRNCLRNCALSLGLLASAAISLPVQAQGIPNSNATLQPITIAQTAPPQYIPTDVTPFTVAPERNSFNPGLQFRVFQLLPERFWFNSTTEISQRLDTNVLFTYAHPRQDYAFRALPNLTIGYNIFKNTALYINYFVIKDVFARNYSNINFPTTQSLSWGIRHSKNFGNKTNLQLDFQARELWQATGLHQFDFLPGITLTHTITPNNIVYGSALLQLRGADYFVAPTREIDPFYTLGYVYRHGLWTLVVNDTLVTNFRHPPFNDAIPPQSNVSMIADIEINHPVTKKFPSLLAFVRAEPIYNWDSHKAAGLSGFDFRLFTGLRLTIAKPSYYAAMDDMRKQLLNNESNAPGSSTTPPATPNSTTSPIDPSTQLAPPNASDAPLRPALPSNAPINDGMSAPSDQ